MLCDVSHSLYTLSEPSLTARLTFYRIKRLPADPGRTKEYFQVQSYWDSAYGVAGADAGLVMCMKIPIIRKREASQSDSKAL